MLATRATVIAPVLVALGLVALSCTPAARDFGSGGGGAGTTSTSTSATVIGGAGGSTSSTSSTSDGGGGTSTSSTSSSGTTSSTSSSSTMPPCTSNADCPGTPNGHGVCQVDGVCGLACDVGFEDCDGDLPGTGCEVDTTKDKDHCGSCTKACFYACAAGTCTDPVEFSVGLDHACAVLGTGELRCWGRNQYGQVGIGTAVTTVPVPTTVNLPGKAVQVACGGVSTADYAHTCARLEDGSVHCWGYNANGQLGNPNPNNVNPTPMVVSGLSGQATYITAGSSHTCAIVTGGQLLCWGNNSSGQLGVGGSMGTMNPIPKPVQGPQMLTADAGLTDTCAVSLTGVPYCWGIGQYGKLGNGSTATQPVPKMVNNAQIPFAQGITAGARHTCAWTDSSPLCWGDNASKAVGTNGPSQVTSPMIVPLPDPTDTVVSMSAGTNFTGAVTLSGAVLIWGLGYLGDGSPQTVNPVPTPNGLTGVARVETGGREVSPQSSFACALKKSGELVCWGDNDMGQIGDGTVGTAALTPRTVVLP